MPRRRILGCAIIERTELCKHCEPCINKWCVEGTEVWLKRMKRKKTDETFKTDYSDEIFADVLHEVEIFVGDEMVNIHATTIKGDESIRGESVWIPRSLLEEIAEWLTNDS